MRSTRLRALLALIFAVALLGACGGSDDDSADNGSTADTGQDGGDSGDALAVDASEFAFDPDSLTVTAGEATTIELTNVGAIEHDITIDEADFKLAVAPTKTNSGTLTMDEPGEYTFYCSVPGHREGGMEGTIVVE